VGTKKKGVHPFACRLDSPPLKTLNLITYPDTGAVGTTQRENPQKGPKKSEQKSRGFHHKNSVHHFVYHSPTIWGGASSAVTTVYRRRRRPPVCVRSAAMWRRAQAQSSRKLL
jgi:hypothetical protein